jgi:hypothetical protein
LTQYVTIETALSAGAQLREQKRASDDTDCTSTGIPQMKNTTCGRITVKYNCSRIQEYVDGIRGKGLLSKVVYLLVKLLPIEMSPGDYTWARTWIETNTLQK